MLAQHFARLKRPIRYAMDPAHAQAIRNYLAIASRAEGVPQRFRELTGNLMGRMPPLAIQAHTALTENHDPGSLLALLDQLHDSGVDFGPATAHPPSAGNALLAILGALHHNIAGYGDHQAGAHPAVLRGYGDEAQQAYKERLVGEQLPYNGLLHLLYPLGNAIDAHLGHAAAQPYFTIQTGLTPGMRRTSNHIPMNLVHLLDATGQLAGQGTDSVHTLAGGVHRHVQNFIAQSLHPALWHYGEHGVLPGGS